ncbi:hypothetical protein [Lentzea atacamensis]|uniref:hypothetical protein n=1 Tax=Lentzea atacamensis TaxID=531938 RepID=UPI0011BEA245|nr:hypothetical protein [Lentzea atacamensis]
MSAQRPNPVDQALAELSGSRFRVLDEPSYRIEDDGIVASFRLQLFVSAGLRPVAVAIQDVAEGGISLTNGCESIVSRVWRDHVPGEPLPPLWVQRIITPTYPGWDSDALSSWQMVTFEVQSPHWLSAPQWTAITQPELDRLVGRPVDDQRGRDFEPEPAPDDVDYALVPMHQIPLEKPFRQQCMTSAAPGRTPPRRPRLPWPWRSSRENRATGVPSGSCCWYHRGDWSAVIETAIRLISEAKARGLGAADQLRDVVLEAAHVDGITGWDQQALHSLLVDPIVLGKNANEPTVWFVNGQHRTRAMRDAGVTEVLVAARPQIGKIIGPARTDER